jgi:hypothetical protein
MRLDPIDTIVQVAHEERRARRFGGWNASISAKDFKVLDYRVIDTRPCDPLMASDCDWGEQDSLANIPRKTMPSWVKASIMDSETGDA